MRSSQSQPSGMAAAPLDAGLDAAPAAAFTPGPYVVWESIYEGMGAQVRTTGPAKGQHGRPLAEVHKHPEAFKTALLFAAAPDLLEALRELCDQIGDAEAHGDGAFDPGCPVCIAHQDARAAISKALGEKA